VVAADVGVSNESGIEWIGAHYNRQLRLQIGVTPGPVTLHLDAKCNLKAELRRAEGQCAQCCQAITDSWRWRNMYIQGVVAAVGCVLIGPASE
jgi:hypothetical protein